MSIAYICESQSLSLPRPPTIPLGIHVCSLHLYVCFAFASKFIYTIFSGIHIHVLMYSICFFLFLTYFTI